MDDFKPSAFTPIERWFTDERARDGEELRSLYRRVERKSSASRFSAENALADFGAPIWGEIETHVPQTCRDDFANALWKLTEGEAHIFQLPVPRFDFLNLKEAADLKRFLRRKEYFLEHEHRIADLLRDRLRLVLGTVADLLPQTEALSPFTIPLVNSLPNPKHTVERLIGSLSQDELKDAGLFVELFRKLYFNMCEVSGIADPYQPDKPLKLPTKSDLPLTELVSAYLKGTPFYDLLLAPIPLKFTFEDRYSHMHALGGSGAGKTTLLQNLILHDLNSDDPPSLVIVDSQGDLINKLSRLALFDPSYGRLANRLVLITPKDTEHPPALNIFDVNRDRLGRYSDAVKEQVTAGVIQTFDYLFAGLLGADLTAKQGVFFRFVARLMLSLPETLGRNATILDMIALMDDPAPYRKAIESLPPIQRNFFERDFGSKTFVQTKEQIRYRLNAVLENPTLARLFTTPKTKIDLFDVLNNGGIVLVDTAKDFLKGSSAHFGRIFISLVLQAILERAVIPERERKPTFLIVDEAAAYFDSNIDDFLTEARKYRCGCVFAHQFLDQATSSLRASLAANTSIKMAGGVSTSDARALASDMRTTHDFILGQPRLHFACHIRNVTPSAISIPVPVGTLEDQPRLSEEAYLRLQEFNRLRVSHPAPIQSDNSTFTERPSSHSETEPLPHGHELRPKPPSSEDPSTASEDW